MRLYLDTEFNGFSGRLISVALVSKSGHEWYEVLPCTHYKDWVRNHVIPVLGQPPKRRSVVAKSLQSFLMQFSEIHVIADWPEDIMHFCSLLVVEQGQRLFTPPMTLELVTLDTPLASLTPHNALSDARALKSALAKSELGA